MRATSALSRLEARRLTWTSILVAPICECHLIRCHPNPFEADLRTSWVFSTLTPSSESSGHTLYNPQTSGQIESGSTWNISYGDGSGGAGDVYADTVVVGGVTATSQAVEAATSVSAQFQQDAKSESDDLTILD